MIIRRAGVCLFALFACFMNSTEWKQLWGFGYAAIVTTTDTEAGIDDALKMHIQTLPW